LNISLFAYLSSHPVSPKVAYSKTNFRKKAQFFLRYKFFVEFSAHKLELSFGEKYSWDFFYIKEDSPYFQIAIKELEGLKKC
jgi:hypothetical protein